MKQSGSINTHHHRLHLIVPYHSGKLIDWLKLLMADEPHPAEIVNENGTVNRTKEITALSEDGKETKMKGSEWIQKQAGFS